MKHTMCPRCNSIVIVKESFTGEWWICDDCWEWGDDIQQVTYPTQPKLPESGE